MIMKKILLKKKLEDLEKLTDLEYFLSFNSSKYKIRIKRISSISKNILYKKTFVLDKDILEKIVKEMINKLDSEIDNMLVGN